MAFLFILFFFTLKRIKGKQRNVDPKRGNVLKAAHTSETCAILWVLSGNKDELFLALCQEDISLTGTRVGTQWEIKKLFTDESLVVEEDFLILWPTRYNHLVKADEICNCAEISLGRGPRCLLQCRQREFSCECFPRSCMHGLCFSSSHTSVSQFVMENDRSKEQPAEGLQVFW